MAECRKKSENPDCDCTPGLVAPRGPYAGLRQPCIDRANAERSEAARKGNETRKLHKPEGDVVDRTEVVGLHAATQKLPAIARDLEKAIARRLVTTREVTTAAQRFNLTLQEINRAAKALMGPGPDSG